MKYIHNFFKNFLRLLLVGLHGVCTDIRFAPDMLPIMLAKNDLARTRKGVKYVTSAVVKKQFNASLRCHFTFFDVLFKLQYCSTEYPR
jgi:hypothetical protein